MNRDGLREITAFFVLAFTTFLFVSLLTHDPADYYLPDSRGITNACGSVGAFLAHGLIEWIGIWGSFALLAALALHSLYRFFLRREMDNLPWKITGLAITLLCIASLEVALTESGRTFPGGHYGQYFYTTLIGRLSWFGTYLLLGLSLVVALLISTDLRFTPMLARAGTLVRGAGDVDSVKDRLGSTLSSAMNSKLGKTLRRARPPRIAWPLRRGRTGTSPRDLKPVKRGSPAEPSSSKSPAPRAPVVEEPPSEEEEYEYVYEDEDGNEIDPETLEQDEEEEAEEDEEYEYEYVDEEEEEEEDEEDEEEEGEPGEEDEEYEYEYEYVDEEEEDEGEGEEEEEEEEESASEPPERKIDDRPPFEVKIREPEKVSKSRGGGTAARPKRRRGKYKLPPVDLIAEAKSAFDPTDRTIIQETARRIEETLQNFKIEAKVSEVQRGPVITQYEVSLAAGIKVHKIVSLSDDLSMALEAESIRIVAPIPGKATVGIEVPNRQRGTVGMKELIQSREFREQRCNLPLALGKDIAGRPIIADLAEMPHLLIAGSTGSGKSVAINTIIVNLLLTKTPEEVKVILVDPKMVELSLYEEIPHLLTPVVTDMKKAPAVLNWLVDKMEERYELLARAGVRNLVGYNELGREALRERLRKRMDEEDIAEVPDFLPYLVIVIDELADLMMTASKEVEASITRLAQKSRAVGIHVILATQRPSVDVITGLIKANMACRIAFKVTSKVDSRTILDRNGAEKLLGKGDLLYLPPGTSNIMRAQGSFISDKEINGVVEFVRKEADPQFDEELDQCGAAGAAGASHEDELFDEAARIVLGSQRGSVTLLQRQLQIGYTRASRLMEILHESGLVGPFKGSKAREVYYTLDEWEAARQAADGKSGKKKSGK